MRLPTLRPGATTRTRRDKKRRMTGQLQRQNFKHPNLTAWAMAVVIRGRAA